MRTGDWRSRATSGPDRGPSASAQVFRPSSFAMSTEEPFADISVLVSEEADLLLVEVRGELDAYTVTRFRTELEGRDLASVKLVVDLSGVTLLDSAGLAALLSLRNRAAAAGRTVGLVCPDAALLRLLRVTGLCPSFALGADLPSVRAALPSSRKA